MRARAASRTGQHRARRRPSFLFRRALAVSLDTPRQSKNFAHQSCAQRDEPRVRLRGAQRGEQTREERAIESPREVGGRGHVEPALPRPSLLSTLVRPPQFLRCGMLRVRYVPLDRSRSLRRFVASCRSESHACAKKARLIVVVEQRRRVEHARTHPQRRGIARAVRGPSTGSARARFCGLAALRPLFEG